MHKAFPYTDDDVSQANMQVALNRGNSTDYVESDISLTLNAGGPTVDVPALTAHIGGSTVEADAVNGVSLTDSDVNHLWLVVDEDDTSINDPATADPISYEANTTGADPADASEISLLIAEIDTTNDVVTPRHRWPLVEHLGATHVFASGFGDDGAAIQSALDEHGSAPATVHLDLDVTVADANAPLEIDSNTKVLIEGDLSPADSVTDNLLQTKDAVTASGGTKQSNVIIEGAGGSLDGNKSGITSPSNGFIANCVHLYGTGLTVRDLDIANAANHNISVVGGSEDVTVENNTCKTPEFSNIHVHFDNVTSGLSSGDDLARDISVENNRCVGGDNTGSIRFAGVEASEIVNNTVRDHTTSSNNHGIRVYEGDDPTEQPRDVLVSGNVVQNVNGVGIVVDNSSTSAFPDMEDVTITDNTIVDGGDVGIQLIQRNSKLFATIVIANNRIKNGASNGIQLAEVVGCAVTGNIILGCTGTAISNNASSDENSFTGNIARANGTDSISNVGTNSEEAANVNLP